MSDEEVISLIMDLDPNLRHPVRFSIMTVLITTGPKTMGEIAKIIGVPWGPLSTHINRLKKSGYVRNFKVITMAGPRTLVEVTEKGLKAYFEYVEKLKKILETLELKAD